MIFKLPSYKLWQVFFLKTKLWQVCNTLSICKDDAKKNDASNVNFKKMIQYIIFYYCQTITLHILIYNNSHYAHDQYRLAASIVYKNHNHAGWTKITSKLTMRTSLI